jgi:transcriptional antiterminator RfaH
MIAETNLKRQNFETFLPMQRTTQRKSNGFKDIVRPLFPGYMFVALQPKKGSWSKVNSTKGVSKLVSFGERPAPIPNGLVEKIKLRCDERGQLMPPNQLKTGDNVTLISGPFANFVATIENIGAEKRIWVLIEFMGQQTRVVVKPEQIRAENQP